MARYTGPTTRLSRRFNQPLFGATKAYEKRPYPPGQHGPKLRRKVSEYAAGLNEKQKLRYVYGLLERQFRRTFEAAKRERGVTGERFLQLLETRLDSIIYLLGFARSRAAARQLVGHGHVRVNGHKVDIASYAVQVGDELEIKNAAGSRQLAQRNLEETRARNVPGWLTLNAEAFKAVVNRLPTREEMAPDINEQLIVEFYSR
ncbi:30S ribosomal protein S4 [Opitutaceae bacterium TAV4]|uniref:30S ribosomal protein S4 n=1 Tax=Geminisphaera colitermitum TaxID=1148786 RepID=UPI000158D621|nr:30S ribosomal protein S4 [Geminisphaera colitermitum]RRJ96090.1 30S ribosomal protein S4 [Opitutaceae bacterium TAV4]RRK00227.1 30S ribosomal protein S4 [Opitutaceae bacterium TAV3]